MTPLTARMDEAFASPLCEALQRVVARLRALDLSETSALRVLFGGAFAASYVATDTTELLLSKLLYAPIVRARAVRTGRALSVMSAPRIRGDARIFLGDACTFSTFHLDARRAEPGAEISFGDRCFVADRVEIALARRIAIGHSVGIAGGVTISDRAGYASTPERRMAGASADARDVAPIEIEDHVWIGRDAHVLAGARIGRGAMVAAGSVVNRDVPAGTIAMGVPARIIRT